MICISFATKQLRFSSFTILSRCDKMHLTFCLNLTCSASLLKSSITKQTSPISHILQHEQVLLLLKQDRTSTITPLQANSILENVIAS
jgi:hypothetical protein